MINLLIFSAGAITTLVLIAVLRVGARLHALADRIAAEVEQNR